MNPSTPIPADAPARPPAPPRVQMPRFTPEQKARVRAALEAIFKRVREALTPMVRLVREAARALGEALKKAAAAVEHHNHAVRAARRDRPAWASPYGPAPRPARRSR